MLIWWVTVGLVLLSVGCVFGSFLGFALCECCDIHSWWISDGFWVVGCGGWVGCTWFAISGFVPVWWFFLWLAYGLGLLLSGFVFGWCFAALLWLGVFGRFWVCLVIS